MRMIYRFVVRSVGKSQRAQFRHTRASKSLETRSACAHHGVRPPLAEQALELMDGVLGCKALLGCTICSQEAHLVTCFRTKNVQKHVR